MRLTNNHENRRLKFIGITITYFFLFTVSLFFAPAVFACVLVAFFSLFALNEYEVFLFLLFSFSTAPLLKYSSGTSYFTFIEVAAIFVICYKRRKINGTFILLLIVLLLELIISSEDWKEILKIFNIMFIYYLFVSNYRENDINICKRVYTNSLIATSFLGLFKARIPRMLLFYSSFDYSWIGRERVLRFSGIFSDPNYYSIALLLGIVIAFQEVLSRSAIRGRSFWIVSFIILTVCGFATISKSFILMYIFVILLLLVSRGHSRRRFSILWGLSLIAAVMVLMPKSLINNLLFRFTSADYDITTGRAVIWSNYLNEIKSSPRIMLLGCGVGAGYLYGRPTHNMYLELLYYLGVFGTVAYLACLLFVTFLYKAPIRRKIANYSGFLVMAACYFFLNGMTAFEFPFYLILSFIIYNSDVNRVEGCNNS